MTAPLAAIVTAAGASTRMGAHKALLEWRGRPLVAHQVATLREAGFDPVVVVTGARGDEVAEAIPDGAVVAHNDDWEEGRSRSIAVGADTIAGCLADEPDQPPAPSRRTDDATPSRRTDGAPSRRTDEATPSRRTDGATPSRRSNGATPSRRGEVSDCSAVLVVAVDQPIEPRILDRLIPRAGVPLVQPVDDDGAGHPVVLGGDHLPALRRIEEESEGLRSLVRSLRPDAVHVEFDELPHWDLNTPEAYREARARDRQSDSRSR